MRRGGMNLRIDELTSTVFAKALKGDPLVILPMGATEEHGPHLPLGTDSFQCEEIVARVAEEFDALVLPRSATVTAGRHAIFPAPYRSGRRQSRRS